MYKVLPKELSISPQVWFTYTESLLEGTPNTQSYIAIVDDLKSDHMILFEQPVENSYFTWFEAFP